MLQRSRGRRRPRSEMMPTVMEISYFAMAVLAASAASAEAATTLCPSDNTTTGYSNLTSLQADLESSNTTDFTLCPSTNFTLDEPIRISKNNTILSCGPDGDVVNACVLEGDIMPFLIQDNVSGIIVQGLTFHAESSMLEALPDSIWCQDCRYKSSNTNDECFSTATSLGTALEAQTSNQEFRICANSMLTLEGPLVIHQDNVTISCGENGTRSEQCALFGGEANQVHIQGDGARLKGLTLIGSTEEASVLCSGGNQSKAYIQDCEFSGHQGVAALMIYNTTGSTENNISTWQDIYTSITSSMEVSVKGCSFEDNRLNLAAIVNIGGVLVSSNNTYIGNTAWAVIGSTGRTSVEDSCFGDNAMAAAAVVMVSNSSLLEDTVGNYGNGQLFFESDCGGILAGDDESCVAFTSGSCVGANDDTTPQPAVSPTLVPNATDTSCFSDFESLVEAVDSGNLVNGTLSACNTTANTTEFDLSNGPMLIRKSNVFIECRGCIFRGGTRHIEVQGNVGAVTLRGITFMEVEGTSIYANISSTSSLLFEECTWANNKGVATVQLVNPDFREPPEQGGAAGDDMLTDNDDDIFPRFLESDGPRSLTETSPVFECNGCVFESNAGEKGIVISTGVSVGLSKVIFEANEVDGSVISAENDEVTLVSSCFIANQYEERLVTSDFSRASNSDNFGENNNKVFGLEPCDGLGTASTCQSFQSDTCLAKSDNSTEPSGIGNMTCFNDWMLLKEATNASHDGTKTVLTLCENTTLDVDAPIIIDHGDVTVKCGVDGEAHNNCTISGGQSHFVIKGTSLSVSFVGISFRDARFISVRGLAAVDSRAIFFNCKWENNLGPAAVLVYNEVDGIPYTDQSVESLSKSIIPAMTTTFESCYFLANQVSFAALAVVDGETTISSSSFEGHNDILAGAVAGTGGAKVSVFSSCFVDNDSLTAGTVYLGPSSELVDHDLAIFGSRNSAGSSSDCNDILEGTLDSCLVDGACRGFCTPFEGISCELPFVNYSRPLPPAGNETGGSESGDSLEETDSQQLYLLRPASMNAHAIINILFIILTMAGWVFTYHKCKRHHLHASPTKRRASLEPAPMASVDTKPAIAHQLSPIDEDDDEESDEDSVFADELPNDQQSLAPSIEGSLTGGLERANSEETPFLTENSMRSVMNTSTGSLHISAMPHKKKKKLRIMKKVKRAIHIGEKKEDGTDEHYDDDDYDSDDSYDEDDEVTYSKYSNYSDFSKNSSVGDFGGSSMV